MAAVVAHGNSQRQAAARSSSRASNRQRHGSTQPEKTLPHRHSQSKAPSPADLLRKIAELEEATRNQENTKKQEAKQRQKDVAAAKKKVAKEIRSAQQALRKSEQEIGKLTQQAARVDQRSELERTKKTRQMQKIDEDMQKLQIKRNALSEALQKKAAAVGDARGKLANMEVAASLLELGVVASAHLLPRRGTDNEFQTLPGALTATDISVQGGVDGGAQSPHSVPGLTDAIDKQGVSNQGAHLESLEAACSEAVKSPSDGSGITPEFEDASTIYNGPQAVMTSTNTRTLDGPVIVETLRSDASHNANIPEVPSSTGADITTYAPKSMRFAPSAMMYPRAQETSQNKPAVEHHASYEDSYVAALPAAGISSTPVTLCDLEASAKKPSSSASTADRPWAHSKEYTTHKQEAALPVSCRIQNAAYNRSAHVGMGNPLLRSSTPWRQGDELLGQNNANNISAAPRKRQTFRQASVEISRCAPPMTIASNMIRYARSTSVLPNGATGPKMSVTPSPTWTPGDAGLHSSATESTLARPRLASPASFRCEPIAAPPLMASQKVYN